ncbi:MAG: pilus assembly protein PilP [Proteobacteria bacterium]|nr:pilus assembly protein PilP [Pseudomonadota bacterium]
MIKLTRLLYIFLIMLLLVSCQKDTTDLDRYFADAKLIPAQQIEPLPEINSPEIFIYEADDWRDPFSNDLQILEDQINESANIVEGEGPDLIRRSEALENYPLDSLYMAGTYLKGSDFWGLIEDPEGVIHRVSLGEYMGQNHGEIVNIEESEIEVSEWLSDGLGGWTKRKASIALREE